MNDTEQADGWLSRCEQIDARLGDLETLLLQYRQGVTAAVLLSAVLVGVSIGCWLAIRASGPGDLIPAR